MNHNRLNHPLVRPKTEVKRCSSFVDVFPREAIARLIGAIPVEHNAECVVWRRKMQLDILTEFGHVECSVPLIIPAI